MVKHGLTMKPQYFLFLRKKIVTTFSMITVTTALGMTNSEHLTVVYFGDISRVRKAGLPIGVRGKENSIGLSTILASHLTL